jgi:hypothetical protein
MDLLESTELNDDMRFLNNPPVNNCLAKGCLTGGRQRVSSLVGLAALPKF